MEEILRLNWKKIEFSYALQMARNLIQFSHFQAKQKFIEGRFLIPWTSI